MITRKNFLLCSAFTVFCTMATGIAMAGTSRDKGDTGDERFCSATTQAQFQACGYKALDDFYIAKALCINVSNTLKRIECYRTARQERDAAKQLCSEQRDARWQVCGQVGEGRYGPSFDPADFDSNYHHLTNPNPYFPLTIGYQWDYAGSLEVNTIVALNETKLIEGVTCIVLNDKRYQDGLLIEETNDWYGQLQFDSARWTAPVGLDGKRRFAPVGPHGLSVATVGRWTRSRHRSERKSLLVQCAFRREQNPHSDE